MLGFLLPSAAKRGKSPRPRPKQARANPAAPRPLTMPGLDAPLEWRESPRTRRYTLKIDAPRGLAQVVTPPGVALPDVTAFVARHVDWVRQRLAKLPAAVPFADGAAAPILGVPHVIRHDPTRRGGPTALDGVLTVGGDGAFLARRVRDYLIKRARAEIIPRVHAKAAALGVKVAGVTLRDTKSRWGSCSAGGRLSFSWRLILAPPEVLDYVVAHEVAHLREMNHSPRFWALCASVAAADAATGRAWLKTHGARLFRYGATVAG